jgi:hypothetical protein
MQGLQYRLGLGILPPEAPYKGRCFGLRLAPVGQGDAPTGQGIHTILSIEPGTSALIWPMPITVEDLRSERLLELRALLDPPAPDTAQVYLVGQNGDESGYFLQSEPSREFYDCEIGELDWPIDFVRFDLGNGEALRCTFSLHQPGELWECALTLFAPQQWTRELLTWVFQRHVQLPDLALVDWPQVIQAVNGVQEAAG